MGLWLGSGVIILSVFSMASAIGRAMRKECGRGKVGWVGGMGLKRMILGLIRFADNHDILE